MSTLTSVLPHIDSLARQFDLQSRLFTNVTVGITDDHAHTRPNANTNNIAWLTGHTVSTRYMLSNILGVQAAEPFPDLYANGKGMSAEARYPSMTALLKDWADISGKMMDRLRSMTEAELIADAPMAMATGKRVIDFAAFIAHHEAYTIGQLGILRRFFGYEAMKYN